MTRCGFRVWSWELDTDYNPASLRGLKSPGLTVRASGNGSKLAFSVTPHFVLCLSEIIHFLGKTRVFIHAQALYDVYTHQLDLWSCSQSGKFLCSFCRFLIGKFARSVFYNVFSGLTSGCPHLHWIYRGVRIYIRETAFALFVFLIPDGTGKYLGMNSLDVYTSVSSETMQKPIHKWTGHK